MKTLTIFCLILISFFKLQAQVPKDSAKILKLHSPETFKAQFNTTEGNFILEVHRSWSPLAADRIYQLVSTGFYNNIYVFRATAKYVQFGITDNKALNYFWDRHTIIDEPVLQSNLDSIVSFATGGLNNRTSQLFINMQNNAKLDTLHFNGTAGFTPVGKIISGMEVVRKFNTQYGDEITFHHQDSVFNQGNDYLLKKFPGLAKIIEAFIIKG